MAHIQRIAIVGDGNIGKSDLVRIFISPEDASAASPRNLSKIPERAHPNPPYHARYKDDYFFGNETLIITEVPRRTMRIKKDGREHVIEGVSDLEVLKTLKDSDHEENNPHCIVICFDLSNINGPDSAERWLNTILCLYGVLKPASRDENNIPRSLEVADPHAKTPRFVFAGMMSDIKHDQVQSKVDALMQKFKSLQIPYAVVSNVYKTGIQEVFQCAVPPEVQQSRHAAKSGSRHELPRNDLAELLHDDPEALQKLRALAGQLGAPAASSTAPAAAEAAPAVQAEVVAVAAAPAAPRCQLQNRCLNVLDHIPASNDTMAAKKALTDWLEGKLSEKDKENFKQHRSILKNDKHLKPIYRNLLMNDDTEVNEVIISFRKQYAIDLLSDYIEKLRRKPLFPSAAARELRAKKIGAAEALIAFIRSNGEINQLNRGKTASYLTDGDLHKTYQRILKLKHVMPDMTNASQLAAARG